MFKVNNKDSNCKQQTIINQLQTTKTATANVTTNKFYDVFRSYKMG